MRIYSLEDALGATCSLTSNQTFNKYHLLYIGYYISVDMHVNNFFEKCARETDMSVIKIVCRKSIGGHCVRASVIFQK